jgi:hypothetical protein
LNLNVIWPAIISPTLTPKPMALMTSLLLEDPWKSILEGRIFYVKDLVIRKWVNKIIRKGFLFKIREGLDFYKGNILNNKVNKETNIYKSYI